MYAFTDYASPDEPALIEAITALETEKHRGNDQHRGLLTVPVEVRVLDTMPTFATRGLFAHASSFEGVLQFSRHAFSRTSPGVGPNIHHCALKVYGVPGRKLLPGDEQSTAFDLILTNHETFYASSLDQMLLIAKGDFLPLAAHHPDTIMNMLKAMFKYVSSLLTTSFYSQAPYQLGDVACKYALLPAAENSSDAFPNLLNPNFLRDQALARLEQGEARFTLCVQIHRASESIADSTKAWEGAFIPVAEITIEQRYPGMPLLDGRTLSFHHWRVLAENQPLSWLGRLRLPVTSSAFAKEVQAHFESAT